MLGYLLLGLNTARPFAIVYPCFLLSSDTICCYCLTLHLEVMWKVAFTQKTKLLSACELEMLLTAGQVGAYQGGRRGRGVEMNLDLFIFTLE